jgi:outer membrane protein insertion porin family
LTNVLCAEARKESGQQAMRLAKIEFVGLSRHSEEEAITASGLQKGQVIDEPTLDAAANKLLGSGLFTKLSYRYRTSNGQAVVTFTVEESKGVNIPVVFDNFVWFSDEELSNAVRREMPTFNGTAPELGAPIDTITNALERLLRERKIPGQVEYTPGVDVSGTHPEHIFSVKGLSIPVCTLHFPGAADVQESELIKTSQPLIDNAYSRKFVEEFATANLIPIYRHRGHLRASFQTPVSRLEAGANGNCKDGVAVTVPVEEGLAYNWEKALWDGNQALTAEVLTTSLGMKSGELADGLKIDSGLNTVRGAYGKQGYIIARLKPELTFDDPGRRVTYLIKVNEGPQFHMGNLSITGLNEGDTKRLQEQWKMKPGDVYDDSYLRDFVKKVVIEGRMDGGKKISFGDKPNRQNLTVDVTIEFK